MIESLAVDIGFWRAAAWITGVLAFGAWAVALGGTADMTDADGRRIGLPLSSIRYWRYLGLIFSAEFSARQKPRRRWSVRLARSAFWMQLVWLAVATRLLILLHSQGA